ncbi:flagellar hook capping protein [Alicyclobacillus cycloheptanicus]|uniref:Flagellar basal-body rod modification protein FlgD n=1 Tax=Alicyclobacillus cycloheptanicus TaxID=1457 RepID=A0ABT9XJR6_9BACL|nr:flagellar hook capping FlgD N-terminal domain-containing protein [Alicyclobacillus cycloheptanicus]MDQ0190554.1 flagellar basal-body rod modification protein FlgD [Alicyclobacillus cycloheptanicus]WDM01396.1 flagellar hook capping protein [Alicyclobacillus cycloheptanicus]
MSSVDPTQLSSTAFLQLMVAQMQYQDPLQPQDNSQFLAQLAQMSELETLTELTQTMSSLQQLTQLSDERQLLGTTVSVTASDGSTVTGTVSSIRMDQNGDPQLIVNGQGYPLSALTEME